MSTLTPAPSAKRLITPAVKWTFLGVAALIALICVFVLPSMCRATPESNRIKSSSNLRQLGLALRMYASENQGMLPPTWRELALTQDITADVFISPNSNDDSYREKDWPDHLQPGKGHCSYVYVAAAGTLLDAIANPEARVLAYEPAEINDGDGGNVLYADGHVDWLTPAKLAAAVAQSTPSTTTQPAAP